MTLSLPRTGVMPRYRRDDGLHPLLVVLRDVGLPYQHGAYVQTSSKQRRLALLGTSFSPFGMPRCASW